jgi:site-specific DNA-methyltransferase (adenine-specific)
MLFISICESELHNKKDLPTLIEMIESNVFKDEKSLREKINEFNSKANRKLINGDCIIELEKIQDKSINLVITDLPYGIDYISNRSQFKEHVTKEGIRNDGYEEALALLNKACEVLDRKVKDESHLYFFTSWKVYPEFISIIEKYFSVKNMIVWNKGNHGAGDLECAWGNKHEIIIFAMKGKKPLNYRESDILEFSKVKDMIHPTQKPVELIKQLLKVSANKKDLVCDPFMGSGSTIKACEQSKELDLSYIGIELDKTMFDKASVFIKDNK